MQDSSSPNRGSANRKADDVRRRLEELEFLHSIVRTLTATLDVNSVLEALIDEVRQRFQVDAVSIALLDQNTGELVFRVAVGEAAEEVIGLRLAPDEGVASWVVRNGEPAFVPVAHQDERFYSAVDEQTGFRTQTMFAVPIEIRDEPIGVIEVINPPSGRFGEAEQRLLQSVADVSAVAIRNAEMYERALLAEQSYESLFHNSMDPIAVLSLEGRVLEVNRRAVELLGYPREVMLRKPLVEILDLSPEGFPSSLEEVRRKGQAEEQIQVECHGEPHTLMTHMTEVNYEGQPAIQWVGRDITEQLALERMREDLTNMIIHDLRNPLSSILNSLQLIQTAYAEHDESLPIMQLLGIAAKSGKKLRRLIDSLLEFSRLESGDRVLNRKTVRPAKLVREAVEQIQPLVYNREQHLSVSVSPDLPQVGLDREMILRVLTNLLDNAVKFTPRGGKIEVKVWWKKDSLRFSVSDTGPGVPYKDRDRIFDRFSRLKASKRVKGTGLGLTFCKLAVEAHDGEIWVEEHSGGGAKFNFTIPLEER